MHLPAAFSTLILVSQHRYDLRIYEFYYQYSNDLKITRPSAGDLNPELPVANIVPSTYAEQWNTPEYTTDLISNTANAMGLDFDPFSLFTESIDITTWDPPSAGSNSASSHGQKYENIAAKALTNGNTTLCSLACQWVIQCNAKGVELDVLYFRMERGFKQGNSPLEGCRVDNQVLLSVLTEIS